jgi:DNA-binding transcriptional LysR family regulator
MSSPDLRQLRHFVAVAERLHFGRATLLSRSRRHVSLTPEGARFLEEAKRILAQLERAAREVGGLAELRLGFVSLADYGVLPGLLKAYKGARPGVGLALREMLSPDQAAALVAGDLDFGLLLPPVPAAGLEHIVVQRERFVAALPSRHRLARARGRLAARELSGEAFVMTPRSIAPGLHDAILALCQRAGFTPRLAQEAIQMQTVVSLVSSGLGVAIVPQSIANLGRRGVSYRELSDPHPRLDLWLAWRSNSLSAAAREFLQHARRVAG